MATQASANPIAVIRQNLEVMAPELRAALPKHVSEEKFRRVAMTAIQQNPDLAGADRRSLFGSIVRLAQDGLLPDGREAALVIFNTKNKSGGWDKKVQAMPMIAGILKKVRQSGDVAKVSAQVVCENDHFVWKLGFDEDVEHSPPALDQPRGKVIGAYATAVLKDGSRLLEVMSLEEIEKVRAVSRSKDKGPWVSWFEEMARKTVMRRLSKRLPMSTDLEDQFDRDATLRRQDEPEQPGITVIDGGLAKEPASRLDALEQHIEDEGEYDEPAEDDDEVVEAEPVEDAPAAEPEPDAAEDPAPEPAQELALDNSTADWTAKADELLDGIRKAKRASYLDAIGEDYREVCQQMPKALCDQIEAALAEKRRELGEGN